jgi:hypothetical protein
LTKIFNSLILKLAVKIKTKKGDKIMAEKGSGTPEKPGTLSNFHPHNDKTLGWDAYTPDGEKIHITTEYGKDSPRNRGILEAVLKTLFGTDNKED